MITRICIKFCLYKMYDIIMFRVYKKKIETTSSRMQSKLQFDSHHRVFCSVDDAFHFSFVRMDNRLCCFATCVGCFAEWYTVAFSCLFRWSVFWGIAKLEFDAKMNFSIWCSTLAHNGLILLEICIHEFRSWSRWFIRAWEISSNDLPAP